MSLIARNETQAGTGWQELNIDFFLIALRLWHSDVTSYSSLTAVEAFDKKRKNKLGFTKPQSFYTSDLPML